MDFAYANELDKIKWGLNVLVDNIVGSKHAIS